MLEVEELCAVKGKKRTWERRGSSGKAHSWKEKRKETPKIKAVKKIRLLWALASIGGSECK